MYILIDLYSGLSSLITDPDVKGMELVEGYTNVWRDEEWMVVEIKR